MCFTFSQGVYDCMHQVKTSPMKLNLVAKVVSNIELILCLTLWKSFSFFQIRGMSIGETLPQMIFCQKKAAKFVQMVCTSARVHKNGWLSTFLKLPTVFRSTPYGISIRSINCSSLVQPLAHSNFFSNSFFPSCTRLWNSLPPDVSAISALPAFKHAIVNLF